MGEESISKGQLSKKVRVLAIDCRFESKEILGSSNILLPIIVKLHMVSNHW